MSKFIRNVIDFISKLVKKWRIRLNITSILLIMICQALSCGFLQQAELNNSIPENKQPQTKVEEKTKIIDADLEKNRRLWSESKIQSYDMVCSIFIGGVTNPIQPVEIKVREGKNVSIEPVSKINDPSIEDYRKFDTVEKIFDEIQKALEKGGSIKINAKYNKEFGYPEDFSFVDIKTTDSGMRLEIQKLERIK